MENSLIKKIDYGNWLNKKFIYVPLLIGILFLALSFFMPGFGIPAVLFMAMASYFIYARHAFSYSGKNVQGQITSLIPENLDWDGEGQVLDIGCGSAALAIRIAKKYPQASITGIDNWGKGWDYSQGSCEQNAKLAGVEKQIKFQLASASKLPFPDGSFNVVLSNLVFHEVMDAPDKRKLIYEALRVLKNGGKFVFQDLFLIEQYYGKIDVLLDLIRSWGIKEVKFLESRNAPFIPKALKLPFMVGTLGMLIGQK